MMEKKDKEDKSSHHKQLVFYEDPLGLLELGVLPLVAPSQVVHVEQHDLERKQTLRKKKEKKRLPRWQWPPWPPAAQPRTALKRKPPCLWTGRGQPPKDI